MNGYSILFLKEMVEELGESDVKQKLSSFSCPINPDIEYFIRQKAIEWVYLGNLSKCISLNSNPLELDLFKENMRRTSVAINSGETTIRGNMFDCFRDIMKAYGIANNCSNEISDILISANKSVKDS